MKKRNSFLVSEAGFTIVETMVVLAIATILIAVTMTSMNNYSDRNTATEMRNNANSTLDVSKGYLLSTGSPDAAELTARLEKLLDGYTTNIYDDRHFVVEKNENYNAWMIDIYNKIDEGLTFHAHIMPESEKITIEGITSDSKRYNNLLDEGVIDK